MSQASQREPWGVWNLPNALTMLRMVLVPVFLVLLLDGGTAQRWWALVVFLVASATDQVDGALARARNQITPFGILMDPIADKALTLGAFLVLSGLGEIPWWITILIAVRELGITALRAVLVRRSIMPASMGGKIKTTLQMTAIVLFLVPWSVVLPGAGWPLTIANLVLYAALAVTVATGVDYVVRGWRLWRGGAQEAAAP